MALDEKLLGTLYELLKIKVVPERVGNGLSIIIRDERTLARIKQFVWPSTNYMQSLAERIKESSGLVAAEIHEEHLVYVDSKTNKKITIYSDL